MTRALLLAAHGSRDPRAQLVTEELAELVRDELAGVPVAVGYLDHADPSVGSALHGVLREYGDASVVPLLFAPGVHANVDLPRLVIGSGARLATPLGAHPLVVAALRDRLIEAGAPANAHVLVVAAGSRDPRSAEVTAATAALLTETTGWQVTGTTVPDIDSAVARARANGAPVAVAPLLLGPGAFVDQLQGAGADVVAAPLGAHRSIALLVALRYAATTQEAAA